jgi:hypothetical protein
LFTDKGGVMVKDSQYVLFTKEALFTMLGELALPPWSDGETTIGEHLDCAVLAENIEKKVDEYRTPFSALEFVPADPLK